jgi:hypothetical protein
MENQRLHRIITFTPLVLVLALSAIYALFLGVYMECRWAVMGCQKLKVTRIYLPDSDVLNHYPDDRTQSISDIEKQLKEKVGQKAEIAKQRALKATTKDQLQGQILDAAVVLREKSNGPETTDVKKLEDSLKRAEKVKAEIDDAVETLSGAEKKLDEEITALNSRLGELHNTDIQRYTKQLTWILFSGMFVVACIGAFVVAVLILYRIHSDSNLPGHPILMPLLLVCILVGYALIRFYIDANYTSTFESFVALLENGAAAYTIKLVNFFDVMGSTVVLALLLAATAILWHPRSFFTADPEQFKSRLDQLVSRRRYLRLVLYAGTIVLVIGIMRIRVLLDWLLTYSLPPTLQASVDDFHKVLISSLGVFYTLLLVAVYVPARFIIINRAQSLPGAVEAELQTEGFSSTSTLTFKEFLPRIAALLAPLLVGPVAELIKTVFQ